MLKPETIKKLTKKLAAASREEREEFATKYPVLNVEGRILSGCNGMVLTTLAVMEGADAPTIVGGYQQWLKAGRSVRKGCKALYMRLPVTYRKKDKAEPAPTESETKPMGFKWVAVFDISQTEEVSA
jgi:N-terminal domain of anti-restriction factor ArdC